MGQSLDNLIAEIDAFRPTDGDWRPLDGLLNELWARGDQRAFIRVLLAVFERFPEGDGAGVFWSIVHGLESLPGYEADLLHSVQRRPSEMGVIMIGRLLRAGTRDVSGVSLVDLLQAISSTSTVADRIHNLASELANRHLEADSAIDETRS